MKKRIVSILLCMAMALTMTACGDKTSKEISSASSTSAESTASAETETSSAEAEETSADTASDGVAIIDSEDYVVSECIKLGNYKGLEFTKTVEPVTDADVTLKIIQLTGAEGEELSDPDATVQMGDTATIMYVGKKDGVAFEGGTNDEPYDLQIGSGSFIDGFEDGIIGMKAGETKDLNLTFPENYSSTELAGQDVVFTVTVNAIKRLVIDDEWVKENADSAYKNAKEYIEANRKVLEEENEAAAENDVYSQCWSKLMEDATYLAYPKVVLDEAATEYEESVTSQAEMYGYTLEDYIEACGVTMDYFESLKSDYAIDTAKETLVLEALMEAENISADSQEYEDTLKELVEEVGAESADELKESYGEKRIDVIVLSEIAIKKVLSYGKVTEA